MNGTANGSTTTAAGGALALPAAAVTIHPESAASVTVRLPYRGRDVMLTLRGATGGDVLGRLDAALTWLEAHGLTSSSTPAPADAGAAPTCPTHGGAMRAGKRGGWYCPVRVLDDDGTGRPVYCRARPGGAA